MKKYFALLLLSVPALVLSSYQAIGDIFKTGMGIGIVIVIIVITVIIFVARSFSKK